MSGKAIITASGKRGVLASGKVGVTDADGNCADCCETPCTKCGAGTSVSAIVAITSCGCVPFLGKLVGTINGTYDLPQSSEDICSFTLITDPDVLGFATTGGAFCTDIPSSTLPITIEVGFTSFLDGHVEIGCLIRAEGTADLFEGLLSITDEVCAGGGPFVITNTIAACNGFTDAAFGGTVTVVL